VNENIKFVKLVLVKYKYKIIVGAEGENVKHFALSIKNKGPPGKTKPFCN